MTSICRKTHSAVRGRWPNGMDGAMEHAEKVCDFAEKLYQKTRSCTLQDDLIYLKLACLLHNCGYFSDIEFHAHCSASLIETFNIPGMTLEQRKVIAQIQQSEGSRDNLRIQQLRAYFQLADALDCCKKQKLSDISIRLDGDRLTVSTVYDGNLYWRRRRLMRQPSCFMRYLACCRFCMSNRAAEIKRGYFGR